MNQREWVIDMLVMNFAGLYGQRVADQIVNHYGSEDNLTTRLHALISEALEQAGLREVYEAGDPDDDRLFHSVTWPCAFGAQVRLFTEVFGVNEAMRILNEANAKAQPGGEKPAWWAEHSAW